MALPVRQQLIYWSAAGAALIVILWAMGNVVLPFIVGGAIAYFLDPVADRLERMGLGRVGATVIIFVILAMVVIIAGLVVIPTLIQQSTDLVQSAPEIAGQLRTFLIERFPSVMEEGSPLRNSLVSIGTTVEARGGELSAGASVLVNVLVFLVVAPVVAFYLLLDWDHMVERIDELLPRDHAPRHPPARRRDRPDAGQSFMRGQGTVCLILGTFYAVALMAVGLQFGLVVGFIAGLLSFIPLCRRDRRRRAGHRPGAVPVLGRVGVDPRRGRRSFRSARSSKATS
jgi:predicted PurR-regulated permease PerM